MRFSLSPVTWPGWLSALCCSGRGTGPQVAHLMTFSRHWFHNWNLKCADERREMIYFFGFSLADKAFTLRQHTTEVVSIVERGINNRERTSIPASTIGQIVILNIGIGPEFHNRCIHS